LAKFNTHQADMAMSGILEFKDLRRASFDISFECVRRSEFEIFGDKGRLKCHTVWQHEDDEALISYELDGGQLVTQKIPKGNHFDLEIDHFVECTLNNKESDKLSMADAVNQAATMEAVYQSVQKSQWILV